MFDFFKWGTNPEDEEFDNRILKKCNMTFTEDYPKPALKDFKRQEQLGRGKLDFYLKHYLHPFI
jgi:hypothetical protein